MILRVTVDDADWIVDTGFGSIGLTGPIRMELDLEQPTPHEPRRIIRRGDYFVHRLVSHLTELSADPTWQSRATVA